MAPSLPAAFCLGTTVVLAGIELVSGHALSPAMRTRLLMYLSACNLSPAAAVQVAHLLVAVPPNERASGAGWKASRRIGGSSSGS